MHAQYDEAHRQEVCCAPLPAADIRSSSRGSSQRPAGDPRRSPVPGNGGLWRRSVGSISRVERRGEAAEHRRSDCPEEVARMQPRVPPTMAAEQAGVSKIGSWWRLAVVPPGVEGGVATLSDSLTVGVQQLQQLSSERSRVPGVRAGTRGAEEGEPGQRLQPQRQGSEAVSCAKSGAL